MIRLFLRKYWLYIVLIVAAATLYIALQYDKAQYHRISAEFSTYRAQVAEANTAAEKAAREALQADADKAAATDRRNQGIIDDLSKRAISAEHDLDFSRRLLAAARKAVPAPAGDPQLATAGEPATTDPAEGGGDQRLAGEIGFAAAECRDAIERLSALQAEIRPQL